MPVEGEDELAGLGRAFNDMSAELSRARESQRGFLESVSHELKTPLTSIRGYAEALEEGAVSPTDGGRVIAAEAGTAGAAGLRPARPGPVRPRGLRGPPRAGRPRGGRPQPRSGATFPAPASSASRSRPRALTTARRLLGGRRRGPPAAGDLEPDRERAAPDPGRGLGHGDRGGRPDRRARHRPRTGRRGPAARVRALLPLRPLPQRARRRLGPRAGDRQGADRRDGRRRESREPARRRGRVHARAARSRRPTSCARASRAATPGRCARRGDGRPCA